MGRNQVANTWKLYCFKVLCELCGLVLAFVCSFGSTAQTQETPATTAI